MTGPTDPRARADSLADPRALSRFDELVRKVQGEELQTAARIATEAGWTIRIAVDDGVHMPLTRDYRPLRLNVRVADGLVCGFDSRG